MSEAASSGTPVCVNVSFVPFFVFAKENVTFDSVPSGHSLTRQLWTIFFPGTSSRFLPVAYPPQTVNAPPTLRETFASAPVNAECFFWSIRAS